MRLRSLPRSFCCLFLLCLVTALTQAQTRYTISSTQQPQLLTTSGTAGPRTLRVVNQCPFSVWIGATGGAVAGKTCTNDAACGGSGRVCVKDPKDTYGQCSCYQDTDCGGPGRQCSHSPIPSARRCFWVLPTPSSRTFILGAQGSTFPPDTTTFSLPETGSTGIRWNGKLFGRTGCNVATSQCETAHCNGAYADHACDPGEGPTDQPYTLVELDLENATRDTYDVALIHGMNVPMDIKPEPNGDYQKDPPENPNWMYSCGYAAGNPASAGLTSCSYSFKPATMNYLAVTPNGAACTTDQNCSGGQKCGLARQSVTPPGTVANWGKLTCGKPIGWWSPTAICGTNANFGPNPPPGTTPATNLFNCTQAVPPGNGYQTLNDLYQCIKKDPANISCYSTDPAATPKCCGCEDWPYPATPKCQSCNSEWVSQVLPKIQFIKDACPTAYSYQYDDKTSTFTCRTKVTPNTASYVITFCPGGNTGLPSTNTLR